MAISQLEKTLILIESATSATAIFPDLSNHQKRYHMLAQICHPDHVSDMFKHRASAAFAKLSSLYASLNGKAKSTTKLGKWTEVTPFAKGVICDLYIGKLTGVFEATGTIKVVQDLADNDLMDREVTALKILAAGSTTEDTHFQRKVPAVLDSFEVDDRRVNVLSHLSSTFFYSLETLHKLFGVGGIPFRHIVWMMNKTLMCLGYAHEKELIHGAVLPEHLMFGDVSIPVGELGHSVVLIDWTCSVPFDQVKKGVSIPLIVKDRSDNYPPEVRLKKIRPSTDLYMAAKAFQQVSEPIPARFKPFFDLCLVESTKSRPDDVWEIRDMWMALAKQEYGERKYVKLEVPKGD